MSWFESRNKLVRTDAILGRTGTVSIGIANTAPTIRVASGSVGILTAPDANVALKVDGNVTVTGTIFAGYGRGTAGPMLEAPDGSGMGQFDNHVTRLYANNATGSSVRFGVVGSAADTYTDIMTVTSNAVGINTTSPEAALHVVGDVVVDGVLKTGSTLGSTVSNPFRNLLPKGQVSNLTYTGLNFRGTTTTNTLEQFVGGAYVPETGNVYLVPSMSGNVVAFNPRANTVTQFGNVPIEISFEGTPVYGGVLGANAKIYCAPYHNSRALIIDALSGTVRPSTGTITSVSPVADRYKFTGGVYAPHTGNVYFGPYRANVVAKFDTVTEQFTKIAIPQPFSGQLLWGMPSLGGDGKIYHPPMSATTVLVIDPNTDAVSEIPTATTPYGDKWFSSVTGADGKVYCIPYNGKTSVLCIDPFTGSTFEFGNVAGAGTNKWVGGCLGPDGRIYCAPQTANAVLVIDPLTKTASTLPGTSVTQCVGMVLAPSVASTRLASSWSAYAVPRCSPPQSNSGTLYFTGNATFTQVSMGLVNVPSWMSAPGVQHI